VDEADLHSNGRSPHRSDALKGARAELSQADGAPPQFELGRVFFSSAWSKAANEGLISDGEYVTELIRHTREENERTMPGVPWPEDRDDKQIGTR
jgi:hypothetical protein